MEKLIKWFVSNKVVSNLLMILIIVTGATTIPMLKMEVFPEIDLNIISVSAVYPGATPSDVEEAICINTNCFFNIGWRCTWIHCRNTNDI